MKIWLDIGHTAQLNFYKNSIFSLVKNHEVFVTIIDRGNLPKIAQKEIGSIDNCNIEIIGRHKGNKYSVIFEANILRFFKLIPFFKRTRPDISIGNGFLHTVISYIFNIPSIVFNDDIERKYNIKIMNAFANEINFVKGSESKILNKKSSVFNALKEWAYLSPNSFTPNNKYLGEYNIEENQYIFVREVNSGSLNYKDQKNNLISGIVDRFPKEYKVLLSLENKESIALYPENWILLDEPLEDIHSLIYYSRFLISSGDSMAREGAILGVPSIYCGIREMKANDVLIDKKQLSHIHIDNVPNFILQLINEEIHDKEDFRRELENDWDDVTKVIKEKIENYNKNNK